VRPAAQDTASVPPTQKPSSASIAKEIAGPGGTICIPGARGDAFASEPERKGARSRWHRDRRRGIQDAVASNDPLKVVDCIQVFHLCLLEKAGNSFLFESGRRLIVPLLAFTRMRVQAKNLDAGPWVPQVPNHQRIVDALRMGDPRLAEQIVIHIMSLFLKSALTVWAH
jgi:DNA-binding GntR family transcriptional regulator